MPDPSTARAVVDHAGVSVADLERSERFWREVLGFEMVEDRFAFPEHDLRGVVLVNVQGARVELFERRDSVPTGPHHQIESTRRQGWFQFALAVPDIEATFAAVTSAGAEPTLPPTTAPDGVSLVAFVRDPDGNLVEFLQRPAEPAG
jgi:catechol 2,3-dioxygenase-like lactoylglutathione lyase family enzyme